MKMVLRTTGPKIRLATGTGYQAIAAQQLATAEAALQSAQTTMTAAMSLLAMITGGTGQALSWRGDYDQNAIYDPDDVVAANGRLWRSLTNQMGLEPGTGIPGWSLLTMYAGQPVEEGSNQFAADNRSFASDHWTFAN